MKSTRSRATSRPLPLAFVAQPWPPAGLDGAPRPAPGVRLVGEDRPLCFLHIPKTGGTSLTDAIARLYPPDRVFTEGGNLSVGYLEALGDRLSGPVFLAGHPGAGVAEYLEGRADLITLLRRPAEQAVSNYLHVVSDPQNGLHAETVGGSLSDFLRRNIYQADYQVGSLCVALATDPARMDALRRLHFDQLLRFIDALPFVGVMERAEACGEVLTRLLPGRGSITLPCLNAAVYRGVSVRTLDRLRREYEMLRDDPTLAPFLAREARIHARAAARLDQLEAETGVGQRRAGGARSGGFVSARRFSTLGGHFVGGAVVADLADQPAHLAYGPYDRLARGHHSVEFHFSVEGALPSAAGRIQIEVSGNGALCLRRRWLAAGTWASARARTLDFVNDERSNVLEFRIRARGFSEGRLVFEGVTVRPSVFWRTAPSVISRLVSRLRHRLGLRPRSSSEPEREALIPIAARARAAVR